VAELSALELTASVAQARAALAAAEADRDHVYAGVRAEEVASLAATIAKAKSRLEYAGLQHDRAASLVRSYAASQQSLDQAANDLAAARADVTEAESNHAAAQAGPTAEERAIADAQVQAAAAALAVLERRLDKTVLRAPADGIVTVVVAEVGEAIRAGQPVLAIEETRKRWLSFNVREDFLDGLGVGATVRIGREGQRCNDAGSCHGALAARCLCDLAGGARGRRPRPQHAAPAARSARRRDHVPAGHDGLGVSLTVLASPGYLGCCGS
jgi:multidrug resistance efflux pump